jgi:hypothetical protein
VPGVFSCDAGPMLSAKISDEVAISPSLWKSAASQSDQTNNPLRMW